MMLQDLLTSRRSVRRFTGEVPTRACVERLVAAAITAPSASNRQPWRFVAVSRRLAIAEMAAAVRAAVDRISAHAGTADQPALAQYAEYFSAFDSAPLVLCVTWRTSALISRVVAPTANPTDLRNIEVLEHDSALIGASLALGHLLLAAHAEGLGACCMTGPLLAEDDLRALLGLAPSWRIAAFVAIGFPAETPAPTPRKSVAQTLTWIAENGEEHGT